MLKPSNQKRLFQVMAGLVIHDSEEDAELLVEEWKFSKATVASLLVEAAATKFCYGINPESADVLALIPDEYQKLLDTKRLWNCADLLVEVISSNEGTFLQILGFGICVEAPNVEVAVEEAIELLNEFIQNLDLWTGPVAGQAAWQKHFRASHRDDWFAKFARQLRDRAFNYPD